MDVYIARQPIFDRSMNIYGYELLHRQNSKNVFSYMDDDRATAELICNSFLVVGLNDLTDGTRAFINFSKKLISSDVPRLLPKEKVVVEILERGQATEATVDACNQMRALGYQLALDDFTQAQSSSPLIEKVDIIKVEFPSMRYEDQRLLLRRYQSRRNLRFLAEKVETREEYKKALEIGYDFFQGYFFRKPTIIKSKEIASMGTSLFRIAEELNQPEPKYKVIANVIQSDLGLSYKFFKFANSVFIGSKEKIKSIPQALSYIGISGIYQWISLLTFKEMRNVENAETIKLSAIRGKLMELLATELKKPGNISEYFFTGMFSLIDILMDQPMKKLLDGLPFSSGVRNALLGEQNEFGQLLSFVTNCENANWEKAGNQYPMKEIGPKRLMELYLSSIRWTKNLDY